MESKGSSRGKRDAWKKRGLFALVSNRPDQASPGGEEDDSLRADDDAQEDGG